MSTLTSSVQVPGDEEFSDDEDWEEYLINKERAVVLKKLQSIAARLITDKIKVNILDASDRWLYHEGPVRQVCRIKTQRRVLLLFNDLMLICRETKGKKLQVRRALDVSLMEADGMPSTKTHFQISSGEASYQMVAASAEARAKWVDMIMKVISEFKVKKCAERELVDNPLDSAMADLRRLLRHENGELNEHLLSVLRLLNEVKKTHPELVNTKARLQSNVQVAISNQAPEVANWLKAQLLDDDENDAPRRPGKLTLDFHKDAQKRRHMALMFSMPPKRQTAMRISAIAAEMAPFWAADDALIDFTKPGWDTKEVRERAQARGEEARARIRKNIADIPAHLAASMLQHSLTARRLLRDAESWDDFDCFRLDDVTYGRPLSVLMSRLVVKHGLADACGMDRETLCRFMHAVEKGYHEVPYHSRVHAADVLQNMSCFLQAASLKRLLLPHEILAGLVGAAIHDFKHPGVSNGYLIAVEDEMATQYNDLSVLENYHCAEAFKLMQLPGHNVFACLPAAQRKEARELVIEMVLATDMRKHFDLHQKLHDLAVREKEDYKPDAEKPPAAKDKKQLTAERRLLLQAAMHCADLANPAKPLRLYLEWTDRVMQEFFAQGDKERARGLPISPMCDRLKPAIGKSQIGFISVIVSPLFTTVTELIPELKASCAANLVTNKGYWERLLAAEESASAPTPPPPVEADTESE